MNRIYDISHTGFLFKGEKAYLKSLNDITGQKKDKGINENKKRSWKVFCV